MDLNTARNRVTIATRDLAAARKRYHQLVQRSARRRRADPNLPAARTDLRTAQDNLRTALDAWNKAQQRPRYTAPR